MGSFINFLFLASMTLVTSKEYVPVLIWSSQKSADSYPTFSAFTRLSSNQFTDFMLDRVLVEKPLILVFMEENLSMEDFSWSDIYGNGAFPLLKNITDTADEVTFLPSVHNPYNSLKKLKSHGYSWKYFNNNDFNLLNKNENAILEIKLKEPDYLEDRPDMLRQHDKEITKIYIEALKYNPNVMALYSGSHMSWIDADLSRYKREEKDVNETHDLIITDSKKEFRMQLTPPIIYKEKTGEIINITKIVGDPTVDTVKDKTIFSVQFDCNKDEKPTVKFLFSIEKDSWWTLDGAEIQELQKETLNPVEPIGAPAHYSYFCNPTVVLKNKQVSLTFKNFQVQPKIGSETFGPVLHCIPYFSIAIWSGLAVVFILSIVLAWGIVMIMDINTNDKFDDPKGKTITITATD